jgi:hypothetical protein
MRCLLTGRTLAPLFPYSPFYGKRILGEAVRNIIISVISSWQIWVVTVVLVIYISLVRYVTKVSRSRPRPAPAKKAKKEKPSADAKGKPPAAGAPKTDELGLEEGGDDVVVEEE